MPQASRRLLLILSDAFFILISIIFVVFVCIQESDLASFSDYLYLYIIYILLSLPIYIFTGQYKGITRYIQSSFFYKLSIRNIFLVLSVSIFTYIFSIEVLNTKLQLLVWFSLTCFEVIFRFLIRDILLNNTKSNNINKPKIAIYGAGEAGVQLANNLSVSGLYDIKFFVDDNSSLWKRTIRGLKIKSPKYLHCNQVDQVFLAIPSISREKRRSIVFNFQKLGIPILQIPSLEEITSGKTMIDKLRPISIDDLLGRDTIPPNPNLLLEAIQERVICVTGAGGSIGAELCRQILLLKPKKLVLFERSEPSLYLINNELEKNLDSEIVLKSVLGSTTDKKLVVSIFNREEVDLVFHAAAYKHVPLVESNVIQGIRNNVISTKIIGEAAKASCVKQVILISTDKAVRPTSVMGATKRLSELIMQALSSEQKNKSNKKLFSMVRFGNVIGSSGSVVPLFKKQIKEGGPITLTDENIIRYFMTIREAAQLVLQSSVLAKGGDVFLLDMGDPVRIKDLAEKMIHLSGLKLKNNSNNDGDIEIITTGLRPGEKLYEELLIDAESIKTSHPLIFSANESFFPPEELWPKVDLLEEALNNYNIENSLKLLSELVPEWRAYRPSNFIINSINNSNFIE